MLYPFLNKNMQKILTWSIVTILKNMHHVAYFEIHPYSFRILH